MDKIVLGTRGSKLALWQAHWVKDELAAARPELEVQIYVVKTEGDARHDLSPGAFGKEGIFTAELDRALIDREIDLAVHSLKDLPTKLGPGLKLASVTERVASHDLLIIREDHAQELESALRRELERKETVSVDNVIAKQLAGVVVGTSSLRRIALLSHYWPALKFAPMRGNLDTRIKKLTDGEYDAIVVAAAGVHRLLIQPQGHEFFPIDFEWYLPAAGQAALGIETRSEGKGPEAAQLLNHRPSYQCTVAERTAMSKLGAGCRVPAGFLAEIDEITLRLRGVVASLDGKTIIQAEVEGEDVEYLELGERLADDLIEQGAAAVLKEARE